MLPDLHTGFSRGRSGGIVIVPIFAWNIPLVSLIFLKRSQVFPILFFSSIFCIDRWGRLSYRSLVVFWILNSNGYIFPLFLCLSHFYFSLLIFKASSDNHFAFLNFLFGRKVSITTSCTMLWIFVHSPSGTLSDWFPRSIYHFHCVIVRGLI